MSFTSQRLLSLLVRIPLVLVGTFLLLELTVRVYLFGVAGLHPWRVDSVRALGQSDLFLNSSDPVISWELKPDLDGWFKLARMRTNSKGLHDREYALEKPPGTFRAAVLGSSVTMPSGIPLDDAFHSRLERELSAESADGEAQFINFAVGGHGPRQELAVLRQTALAYDPDLVVFCLTRISAPHVNTAWDVASLRWTAFRETHPFFESFLWKLIRVRTGSETVERPPLLPRPIVSPTGRNPAAIERNRKLLDPSQPDVIEKLAETGRDAGIPIVILRLGIRDERPDPIDRVTRRRALALGMHYVDTRPAFARTDRRDFWIHELDAHPNSAAHARFAAVLGNYLRDNGLLVVHRRE